MSSDTPVLDARSKWTARALQGMTKHAAKVCSFVGCAWLCLQACTSDTSPGSTTGTTGTGPIAGIPAPGGAGTPAIAGQAAPVGGAGKVAVATGGAGSAAIGGSGGVPAAAGAGATAGTPAAGSGVPNAGSGAGGVSGSAAAGSGGKAGSSGAGGSGGTTDPGPTGPTMTVNDTIVVGPGQTYDGKGRRFVAGSGVGNGSQDEGQKPVFKLESGATLSNVVLGNPAADGIHCHGDATLRNITWEDIGEDAMTIKEKGTVTLDGGSAKNGEDKVFQINAESTFKVSNFKASNAGKFIRQNGDTKFKVAVFIDKCDISNMDEAIFRTDSSVSTVEMTNTRYSKIGDDLFIGVSAGNIKQSNNTEY